MKRSLRTPVFGGLGNQLFILASSIAVARKSKRTLELDTTWFAGRQRDRSFDAFRRSFELHRFPQVRRDFPIAVQNDITYAAIRTSFRIPKSQRILWHRLSPILAVDQSETIPNAKHRAAIVGHMFKPNWFDDMRRELQQMMVLSRPEEIELELISESWRREGSHVICLHVRRGDLALPGSDNPVMSVSYHKAALERIMRSDSVVVVFSDSPQWCLLHPFYSQFNIVSEPDPVRTFRLMNRCDAFVLSPSTLSWWGAWMAISPAPTVVVPKPFQPINPLAWQHLVMETWIELEAQFTIGAGEG